MFYHSISPVVVVSFVFINALGAFIFIFRKSIFKRFLFLSNSLILKLVEFLEPLLQLLGQGLGLGAAGVVAEAAHQPLHPVDAVEHGWGAK